MVFPRASWAQSRYVAPGGCLVAFFAFAYGTHRWQQVQHGSAHQPKRQYLLHHELEDVLDMFEAAVLGDATATLIGLPQQDHATKQPFRAVLNQFDVGQAVDALRLAHVCDVDEDLFVRAMHVVMYVASLRVTIQAAEASESIAVNGLPKSYLPFDALFSFARIDWEQSVLRLVDDAKLRERSFPDVGDRALRRCIEDHFFDKTMPVMRSSANATSTVGWRLIRSKFLLGVIGPVRRNPRRNIRLLKRVGLLVAVEAVYEVTLYLTNALQRFVELGALAPLARMFTLRVSSWTTAVSEEESAPPLSAEHHSEAPPMQAAQIPSDSSLVVVMRPHLVAVWMSTTLQLVKLLLAPLIEELNSTIRMDLQTEWSYELGVFVSQLDEPMREQSLLKKACSTAALKRLASQVADWMVKRWVHAFGRTLGSVAVLGFGQLWLGDRSLPVAALALHMITSGTWVRVCGLGNVWPFSGSAEPSERAYLLEALDGRSPPSVQPLVGVRLMLQVLADDYDMGSEMPGCGGRHLLHPTLALVCGSSTVLFGEVGFLPLYDTDWSMLLRVDRLVRATCRWVAEEQKRSGTSLPLLVRSMAKHLRYVSLNCLTASLSSLRSGLDGQSVSNAAAARYLDPEEPGLLAKGAAYIHVFGSYHDLFARWRFITLRTLGLDMVHTYRQVGASLASSHGSAWRKMLTWLQEFQLDDAVLRHLLFALEDLAKQFFLCIVLQELLPLSLTPRPLSVVSGRDSTGMFPQELLGRLIAYKAMFQRSGLGLDLLYVDAKDTRLRKARELEELLCTLPLLSAAAVAAANDSDWLLSRARERMIISATRPELSFTDEHLIYANFKLREGVAFNHVDFVYPGSAAKALEDVSFVAKAQEFTAIIGKTGSGKSTIVNLLKRLYRPLPQHANDHSRTISGNERPAPGDVAGSIPLDVYGEVTFDGIPLRCFEPDYVREIAAYVPQHPHVVPSFTFAQNIAMFRQVSMRDVVEAGRLAGCEAFILATPLGYDQLAGAHLSGGEKQRIEIARAIVIQPQLLILDEATSKLDAITEQSVQGTLNAIAARCTMISIAHRMSTLKHANRYVVLHGGRVVQEGTHDALMADDASKACDAQQLGGDWSYKAQLNLQALSAVGVTRCLADGPAESIAPLTTCCHNQVGRSAIVAVLQAAATTQPPLDSWTDAHCQSLFSEMCEALRGRATHGVILNDG